MVNRAVTAPLEWCIKFKLSVIVDGNIFPPQASVSFVPYKRDLQQHPYFRVMLIAICVSVVKAFRLESDQLSEGGGRIDC